MARRVVAVDNILFHQFGEEAVLLNLNNETYYRLNGSAIQMWETLLSSDSVEQAKAALLTEFDVTAEQLTNDLEAFIHSLQDAKLVEIKE